MALPGCIGPQAPRPLCGRLQPLPAGCLWRVRSSGRGAFWYREYLAPRCCVRTHHGAQGWQRAQRRLREVTRVIGRVWAAEDADAAGEATVLDGDAPSGKSKGAYDDGWGAQIQEWDGEGTDAKEAKGGLPARDRPCDEFGLSLRRGSMGCSRIHCWVLALLFRNLRPDFESAVTSRGVGGCSLAPCVVFKTGDGDFDVERVTLAPGSWEPAIFTNAETCLDCWTGSFLSLPVVVILMAAATFVCIRMIGESSCLRSNSSRLAVSIRESCTEQVFFLPCEGVTSQCMMWFMVWQMLLHGRCIPSQLSSCQ